MDQRARYDELKGRKRLAELQAKRGAAVEPESGGMGDFVNSMSLGSSIGEHLPLIGKPIANLGTMIGSGIQAATEAPFSDASMGDIYDRNMRLSDHAETDQAGYDAKSPAAGVVKSGLAGIAVAPFKRPMPAGGEAFPHGLPSSGSPINAGQFSMGAADPAKTRMMEYLKDKFGGQAMSVAKELGEDMLPYPARMALRLSRKFGKKP